MYVSFQSSFTKKAHTTIKQSKTPPKKMYKKKGEIKIVYIFHKTVKII